MQALGTDDEIREAVRVRYSLVAREPEGQYNFRVGRPFAEALGCPASFLDELLTSVTAAFTGVACPSLLADVQPGQTVVDLGSGGGLDLVVLARKVGPRGRAIGIDFAQDMVDRARQNIAALDLRQTELRQATAEDTGVQAVSVDWVVINGLLNLTPDKSAVLWRSGADPRADGSTPAGRNHPPLAAATACPQVTR